MLKPGMHQATLESVYEREGSSGPYWQWTFKVGNVKLLAFSPASLKRPKTRQYLEAVLDRSVDPEKEFYPSYLGSSFQDFTRLSLQERGTGQRAQGDVPTAPGRARMAPIPHGTASTAAGGRGARPDTSGDARPA
jgi:hypothetical protein